MRSLVTSKNVSWPRLIWPTLQVDSAFYPPWDSEMSISFRAE